MARPDRAPDVTTVVDAVRRWAVRTPDRTAVVMLADGTHESALLSYRELDLAVTGLGSRLARTFAVGSRVLLSFPSGPDFIVTYLACLWAGIIAVPVAVPGDSRRAARLRTIVDDATASGVLTDSGTARLLGMLPGKPFLGVPWQPVDVAVDPPAVVAGRLRHQADSVAFLQYTSGSTSTPKGVTVSHRALTVNLAMTVRAFSIRSGSTMVSWLPVFRDMGLIGGILAPLAAGARVVLMPPTTFLRDPLSWLRVATRYRATHTAAPNFGYESCVRRASDADLSDLDLSTMQVAIIGAEPVRAGTLERFSKIFAPVGFRRSVFYLGYGLAEATLFVAGRHLHGAAGRPPPEPVPDPGVDHHHRRTVVVNCGPADPGQRVVIVDEQSGARCPDGQIGEIWVAGANVMAGYWDDAAATAAATGTLPDQPGCAFLRTGDLGFLHDGDLYVAGRSKDVIIIAGRNHYPQDLEVTVEAQPAVRAAGAAAFPVPRDGAEGVGIVAELARGGIRDLASVAASIIRAVWDEHALAVAELALVRPGKLAKTTSGKVRRQRSRELLLAGGLAELYRWPAPRPTTAAPASTDPAAAATLANLLGPGTSRADSVRSVVAAIRAETAALLGFPAADAVPADTSPQALGLDSIGLTELGYRLTTVLGFPVPVELIRATASPTELGSALVRHRLSYRATGGLPDDLRGQLVDHRDEIIGVLRRTDTVEPMVPTGSTGAESGMSSGQQRLWLVEQMVGPSTLHHVHVRLRWRGRLDPALMSAAAHELARRHAALRTVFRTSGAAPVAVVRSADEESLVEIATADRSGAAADELLRGQQHTPFDLASGPLTRIAVVTVADDEHLIAVTQHHLVTDGWSVGLLLAELVHSYGALMSGRPAAASPSDVDSVDYPDFVRWEKARRAAPPYRNRLDWWRRHLAGVVPLNLPWDGDGTARDRDQRGSTWHFRVPARLLHQLRALARQLDTTPYVVLLAAWAVLLHRHTGQDDIVIGTVTSGRDRPELAGTVGFLANTVVLRCDLSDGPTVTGLIRRLRSLTAQVFAHEVPFADVVAATAAARDTGLNPLFQAAFVYENLPASPVADPSVVPGLVSVATEGRVDGSVDGTAKFDLSLVVGRDGDGLVGLVDCPRARFSPATIARLAEHYLVLLDGIGTAPDTPVGALPMTRAADRRRLLGRAGTPTATSPTPMVDLFREQVRRRPDAVALTGSGGALTYRQLDERAYRAIAEEPDGTPGHPRRRPSSPHPIEGATDHATIRHDLGPRRTR
ncbi:condensation domain-containing protein [Solwaraspora sp. WMMD792]|uniref:condensation domain-containing protein n=1 Tax=Solwaraspora sp. WMMD792 TaxID=3016099 RepID=UPI0024166A13|nr:condensation domain-containing protein [Solwaraspora sp. WMMD792]MDG4771375.1 AMP-binding protein [Solwaraspora sp. WMMD792]